MTIAAGTSNLYFDRDTKLFVGEQLGRSVGLARATVDVANTISLPGHGLEIGSRIVAPIFGSGVTAPGLSSNRIFYVSKQSFTADQFMVTATMANAMSGSNPKAIDVGHVFPSDSYMHVLDQVNVVGTTNDLGKIITMTGATVASNIITKASHGLSTSMPVVFVTATGVTGITVGTVYYVSTTNFAAGTFSLAASLATIATPIALTGTSFTTGSMISLSQAYGTAGTATISGTAPTKIITFANFPNKFVVGDTVAITGMSAATNLIYNGVYTVTTCDATQFTVLIGDGTNGVITNPETIRISKTVLWELPILKGYSMAQGTETAEVTLNEFVSSSGLSRRGRSMFTTAMKPTEWSFDTYTRPYKTTNHYCLEEPLWAAFIGSYFPSVSGAATTALTSWGTPQFTTGIVRSTTDLQFNFAGSNGVILGTLDLYFVLGANRSANRTYTNYLAGGDTTIYMVKDAVVNEASISFDVDGISQVSWSGLGSSVIELGYMDAVDAASRSLTSANFIRNKLTTVSLVGASPTSTTYALTLTSGNITFSNNISYLTPDSIGIVDKPLGHVAGTRAVSGSFTCYLDESTNGPIDLFQNMAQVGSSTITSSFALDFYIGGGSNDTLTGPGIQIKMAQAHLEIPTMNFDDVISLEANFHALPSTTDGTDEVTYIKYKGV